MPAVMGARRRIISAALSRFMGEREKRNLKDAWTGGGDEWTAGRGGVRAAARSVDGMPAVVVCARPRDPASSTLLPSK